ncbi:MauE/DoxX family redox-associated membrane protein [Promicromonospora sp. NPDC059942]|uniref:MauE/DoxX family redox-associated membrane protein n=1 Tax=Promicromonospora sp. NPDC059942 TaxID=3347009 RepID=UPI00365247C4
MLVTLVLFVQLAVAGVLLTSGVAKLRGDANRNTWATVLGRAPKPLRHLPAAAMSRLHVGVEVLVGGALLLSTVVPRLVLPALVVAALLLVGFTGLALYSAVTGRSVTCSCFGASTTPLGWAHVGRNLVLTGLTVSGVAASARTTGTVDNAMLSTPGHAALAVLGAVAVTALTFFFDDVIDLLVPRTPVRSGVRGPVR